MNTTCPSCCDTPPMLDRRTPRLLAAFHGSAQIAEALRARLQNPSPVVSSLSTGVPQLDRLIPTLRPGNLYVLAARPGCGLRAVANHVVRSVITTDPSRRVAMISFDLDRDDVILSHLAAMTGISPQHLNDRNLTPVQLDAVATALRRCSTWQLDIIDPLEGCIDQAAELLADSHTGATAAHLLIIDGFADIQGPAGHPAHDDLQASAARAKMLAIDLQLPVMLLVTIPPDTKDLFTEDGWVCPLTMADLRKVGRTNRVADGVIFLDIVHRTENEADQEPCLISMRVAYNRLGTTGASQWLYTRETGQIEPAPADTHITLF